MDRPAVIEHTRRWIACIVIGLNLCPFARRVFDADKIRYAVSESSDESALLEELRAELLRLVAASAAEIETTLLIHPGVLENFLEYNDFLDDADYLLERLGLSGVIQIASFHPGYQFAETEPDAAENYTNRSPYPMLHLLREESITQVADDPDELLAIPERNIARLKNLGKAKLRTMLEEIAETLPIDESR